MTPVPPEPVDSDAHVGPLRDVTVVGCGLVGGSLLRALAQRGGLQRLRAFDREPTVRSEVEASGVAEVHDDLAAAVAGADLVVLAVPVPVVGPVAAALASLTGAGAIVTDTGSVKGERVREVESTLGNNWKFIGGHPMAGSERSGFSAADPTLFQGATWLLTPTESADPAAFDRLSRLLGTVGARVLAVDPAVHDRLVAVASHLPQLLASTLMAHAAAQAQREGDGVLRVAGGGFRDVTRVAASDPDLWIGILSENREAVLTALSGFRDRLGELEDAVRTGDWPGVRGVLATAREARLALPRKERAGVLIDLVVPVPDQPGALAAVTTALGEAGINIEDIAMRHAGEGLRGAMVLGIDGHDTAEQAQSVLADRGFLSHIEPR